MYEPVFRTFTFEHKFVPVTSYHAIIPGIVAHLFFVGSNIFFATCLPTLDNCFEDNVCIGAGPQCILSAAANLKSLSSIGRDIAWLDTAYKNRDDTAIFGWLTGYLKDVL